MKGTHVTQRVLRKGRPRCLICYSLAMLLCFIAGVICMRSLAGSQAPVLAQHVRQGSKDLALPLTQFAPISINHPPAKFAASRDDLWQEIKLSATRKSHGGINFYRTLRLKKTLLKELLFQAPMEFTKATRDTQLVITLPMPDGTFIRFRVEESPMMAPQLAARFPDVRTYRGRGLDDPTATTRFDVTPAGFHAIVLSTKGTTIIEPAARGRAANSNSNYISYDQRDASGEAGSFHCLVSEAEQSSAQPQNKQFLHSGNVNLSATTGTILRTYRLALAATAEYTQTYGGGTISGALSALTTTVNAVNAIYERDLAIHLTLVDNETSIIFTNPATDGYTSDDPNSLLSQNQVILDQRIGSANYDIGFVLDGHVYAFQPGHFLFQGAGQFESVCVNGQKGKGVAIFRSIEPSTITAIYVVAHELGHKFGALHTLNGTTEDCAPPSGRFAQVAYEPGSGSTIMGFRGGTAPNGTYLPLCTFEDLHSTDTYFHTASIDQIVNYTTFGNGSFCPAKTDTGNNPPAVDAGPDYTIPAGTPFRLDATASDADADALTYCWEEFDLGAAGPPHTDNGNRPIFRSFAPAPSPSRTFPQLSDILSGTATFGESLPVTTRSMNFRVTVRDNHPGGGGVNTGAMRVNVTAGSGPFVVTQPTSATTWAPGSNQTVKWEVANTSAAPVSCGNVRVLLSVDGGNSFPFTLAASTPNNGSVTISVPNTPTLTARIRVEAVGNIFFNISLPNFSITPNPTIAPTLLTEENTNRAIALDSVTFLRDPFPLTTANNFSLDQRTRITLFAVGLELTSGEDPSVVTAQAEDVAHRTYPLTVESIGKVPILGWLTQVSIRLPDGLGGAGDVLVSVALRGAVSNKVLIGIR